MKTKSDSKNSYTYTNNDLSFNQELENNNNNSLEQYIKKLRKFTFSFKNRIKAIFNYRNNPQYLKFKSAREDIENCLDVVEIIKSVKHIKLLNKILLHHGISTLIPYMKPFIIG